MSLVSVLLPSGEVSSSGVSFCSRLYMFLIRAVKLLLPATVQTQKQTGGPLSPSGKCLLVYLLYGLKRVSD